MKNCLGPTEVVDISFSWLPSLPLTVKIVLGHMHHQEKVFITCLQALVKQFRTNVPGQKYLETELCSPLMFMSQELVNIEIFINTP